VFYCLYDGVAQVVAPHEKLKPCIACDRTIFDRQQPAHTKVWNRELLSKFDRQELARLHIAAD
jgi:hypothetical protein